VDVFGFKGEQLWVRLIGRHGSVLIRCSEESGGTGHLIRNKE